MPDAYDTFIPTPATHVMLNFQVSEFHGVSIQYLICTTATHRQRRWKEPIEHVDNHSEVTEEFLLFALARRWRRSNRKPSIGDIAL